MSILLLILKIIGIILLVVLGLILALLLIILLVPLRYSFYFQANEKKLIFGGKITWLIKLIQIFISYKEEELSCKVKVFIFTLFGDEKEEKKKPDALTEPEKPVEKPQEAPIETSHEESLEKPVDEQADQPAPEPVIETEEEPKKKETEKKTKKKKKKEQKPDKSEGESWTQKVIDWKEELSTWPISVIVREVKRLVFDAIKHIFPRRISGYLRYGFDDPSLTGRVTGAAAGFYPLYGDKIRLYPDFMEKVLEGDLCGSGRIRMGYLLFLIIRALLVKEIRQSIIRLWKMR